MSKKQKRILWPVLLVAVVASIAIGFVWARTAKGRSTSPEVARLSSPVTATAGRQSASSAGQQNLLPQVEVELITVRPTGFEAKEITRPTGRFLLGVDNKTGLDEVALRLNRDTGLNLRLQRLPRKRRSWRSASLLVQGNSQRERVETELITIFAKGFEPAEITRPAGKFILAVDNRSGIEDVELRLDRQEGGRVHAVRVRRTAPEWRATVDLRPGVYVLSEAGHPSWICRLTITSH